MHPGNTVQQRYTVLSRMQHLAEMPEVMEIETTLRWGSTGGYHRRGELAHDGYP
jgi:hypothetical protein